MDFPLEDVNIFDPQINPLDNNQFDQSKNITVIFKQEYSEDNGKSLKIQCNLDEKVSSVIKKYRNMAYDFESEIQFIYNTIPLNPSLTVSEAGLNNNSHIIVVYTGEIMG